MRFAEGQEIQEVLRRRGVDVAAMLLAAQVPHQHRREPDDVELANLGVFVVEPEQDEVLVDGGSNRWVRVDDAAQELAPDAILLFNVDEEKLALVAGAFFRRLPVVLLDEGDRIESCLAEVHHDAHFAQR